MSNVIKTAALVGILSAIGLSAIGLLVLRELCDFIGDFSYPYDCEEPEDD